MERSTDAKDPRLMQGIQFYDEARPRETFAGLYPDVETFLDKNADIFRITEESWDEVQKTVGQIKELLETPLVPNQEHVDSNGVVHRSFRTVTDEDPRSIRRFANSTKVDYRRYIAQCNQDAWDSFNAMLEYGLPQASLKFFSLDQQELALANTTYANLVEEVTTVKKQKKHGIKYHDEIYEELSSLTIELRKGYGCALQSQYFGTQRLREVLSDDSLAAPFLELVEELIDERARGINNFPGLLETLQTHIDTARITQKNDYVHGAMKHIVQGTYSSYHFVSSLLETQNRELATMPKELAAAVAAVQAVANIVSLDESTGISKEDLARRVSAHFETMPSLWHEAYDSRLQSETTSAWKTVRDRLAPFSHQGRLRSNVPTSTPILTSGTRKKGKQGKVAQSPLRTRDIEDINAPVEQPPIESFIILKGTDGSNRATFTYENIGTVDTLMEESFVTKFLEGKADLGQDLQECLQFISTSPFGRGTAAVKEGNFTVAFGDTIKRGRLRRFSMREASIQAGSHHPEAHRLRIVFGVCESPDGTKHIAIKSIGLRDDQTYS